MIQRGIISYSEAEEQKAIFENDFARASFIWPADQMDLASMRQHHPIVFLAVMIVTAHGKLQTRQALEREFKEIVARKIIVENTKDLDLLRGLMIHFLWLVLKLPLFGTRVIYTDLATGSESGLMSQWVSYTPMDI